MTRIQIINKVFSEISGRPEDDLNAWAETHMPAHVREHLCQKVTSEEAEKLLTEYREAPSTVLSTIIANLF